jgi:hypothetical protein
MRRTITLALLLTVFFMAAAGLLAAPVVAGPESLTAAQFGQQLALLSQKRDKAAARAIAAVRLTERPDPVQQESWQSQLPGKDSIAALRAVVDAAAILDPPPSAIPADPRPDIQTQVQIMNHAIDYARNILHRFPDFSALRSSTEFGIASPADIDNERHGIYFGPRPAPPPRKDLGPAHSVPSGHLYLEESWTQPVTYRDGHEVDDAAAQGQAEQPWLTTQGEFGPILSTVLVDAARGRLVWSHWEQDAQGRIAVFHYEVPRAISHYSVQLSADATPEQPAYSGELSVDPDTGSILRITLHAWLREPDTRAETGIAVEYGHVIIGGKTYICPVHGVAYLKFYPSSSTYDDRAAPAPTSIHLNDVTFTHYHVFRSDVRILSATDPGP